MAGYRISGQILGLTTKFLVKSNKFIKTALTITDSRLQALNKAWSSTGNNINFCANFFFLPYLPAGYPVHP
jgi:hypothetical protein